MSRGARLGPRYNRPASAVRATATFGAPPRCCRSTKCCRSSRTLQPDLMEERDYRDGASPRIDDRGWCIDGALGSVWVRSGLFTTKTEVIENDIAAIW